MDIVTWQGIKGQGSKTSVSALRRDQDGRAMANRGGAGEDEGGRSVYEEPI